MLLLCRRADHGVPLLVACFWSSRSLLAQGGGSSLDCCPLWLQCAYGLELEGVDGEHKSLDARHNPLQIFVGWGDQGLEELLAGLEGSVGQVDSCERVDPFGGGFGPPPDSLEELMYLLVQVQCGSPC